MTNSNGVFIISEATVNQRFGYEKADNKSLLNREGFL